MEQFKHKLAELHCDILRFAKIQLRDEFLAEDIVQDTLAAAIAKHSQFRGEAGLKTWVLSILKNKIADYFRSSRHMISLEGMQEENDAIERGYNGCFDESGHWQPAAAPQYWQPAPEDALCRQDFFRALENCMQGLPHDTARIFYLREIMGWEVVEICREFSISKENCYVILHRARNGLRQCLQQRWFDLADTEIGEQGKSYVEM
ncbi:sigma-70 family RNA polymerase sigma factor [Neisseria musculi]|uniref:RNA polymerase sigma factor sigma-70 family protein n=1 Tax=Neisseria musculi TaxID=1815583 RepID=A0A7H1MBL1_9NEIS|nr:sigma-70 family RNA polymerase sigma factor [Neisseria musculi]QNT59026.1 RNA polymerase sigma factor, sigma-70 family protein [Neisseria musculi]